MKLLYQKVRAGILLILLFIVAFAGILWIAGGFSQPYQHDFNAQSGEAYKTGGAITYLEGA